MNFQNFLEELDKLYDEELEEGIFSKKLDGNTVDEIDDAFKQATGKDLMGVAFDLSDLYTAAIREYYRKRVKADVNGVADYAIKAIKSIPPLVKLLEKASNISAPTYTLRQSLKKIDTDLEQTSNFDKIEQYGEKLTNIQFSDAKLGKLALKEFLKNLIYQLTDTYNQNKANELKYVDPQFRESMELQEDDFEDEEIEIEDDDNNASAEAAQVEPVKLVLECSNCGALVIKEESEVEVDDKTDFANVEEKCAFCDEADGFKIIGTFSPYASEEEPAEETIEAEDDDEAVLEESASKHAWVVYDENGEYVCAYPEDKEGLARQKAKEMLKATVKKEEAK